MAACQILSSSSSIAHRFPPQIARSGSFCSNWNAAACTVRVPTCSCKLQEISMDEPLKSEFKLKIGDRDLLGSTVKKTKKNEEPGYEDRDQEQDDNEKEEEEEEGFSISRIQVPRQKYIAVSKNELLDAIVSTVFDSQDDKDQFVRISMCLDSILHAEHKSILEEMRTDYIYADSLNDEGSGNSDARSAETGGKSKPDQVLDDMDDSISNSLNGIGSINEYGEDEEQETESNKSSPFNYAFDFWNLLGPSSNVDRYSGSESRVAVSTRFQRAFMQLLHNAQFEELSATDLRLTSALNTDYLLNLPIYVDWKRASESNAIIFRRGYATERQKGLLIGEKLDYLQSRLLQRVFFIASKPLEKVGKWITEGFRNLSQTQEVQDLRKRVKLWVKELSLFRQSYFSSEQSSESLPDGAQISDSELPIWLAAQRAVSRYEGLLSPVGPRERLLRKLFILVGLTPPTPERALLEENSSDASEPYLRPIFLSRISLSDIWRPATRKYCGNDLWKMLKTSVSILLSRSILQEPSFQELILLYTNNEDGKETKNDDQVPSLQLKIYERIPIPDLPVIFPHKKLSFRIIDTVRLDVASLLGLLAFFINYKFENILSSPYLGYFLDVIAVTALIIYVTRVALGYKQTWDRYQLLVNKTLYEKTLASGFGSVHFLLDASEQQQYKEAILTYAILLKEEKSQLQGSCHRSVGDKCEKFMYDVFKEKVEMPVDKAVNLLTRLGMVSQKSVDGRFRLQATPCPKAYEALKERWSGLLGSFS